MSVKSSSRLSATRMSDTSHPSLQKSVKTGSNLRPFGGSATSLLLPGRPSAVYRIDKTGFKVPRYQNSYRLRPYNPFHCESVEKILEDVMNTNLTGIKYNPSICLKLCQDMSSEVRSRIHKKDFDRYKYVVVFTIIEKSGQAINMATSRLGDVEMDNYVSRTFENSEIMSVGTVYGIYYE